MKNELICLGMRMSIYDPAMFMYEKCGSLEGIVCIHVDDFCWGGTETFNEKVINGLEEKFLIGSKDSRRFKYVGINVRQQKEGIMLDQEGYIKSLKPVEISHKRSLKKDTLLNEDEKHKYRSVVGQLNWIGTQTRPDISFDVCGLSTLFGKCTIGDMMDANKVIKRVKTDQVHIFLPILTEGLYLECYSDASFANLSDCGSQGGLMVFLSDTRGKRCPIMWKSRKIRRVVKSTLAAETMALLEVAECGYYVGRILEDIGIIKDIPIRCYVDNQSLVTALRSMRKVDDKYLRINIACLKGMLEKKDVSSIEWVNTGSQLANCLTKKGASPYSLIEAITLPV